MFFRRQPFRIYARASSPHFLSRQVCAEPPPQAVSVTLPAFAVERHGARSYRSLRPQGARQQTHRPHAAAAVDRWDRRTDGQTDGRPAVT